MASVARAEANPGGIQERIAAYRGRVDQAKEALGEAVGRAGFRRDPFQHVLEAQAGIVDLYPDMLSLMDELRQPVRDEELRRAVIAGVSTYTGAAIREIKARTILIVAGVMFATALVVAGAGYWLGRSTEAAKYVDVPAGLGIVLKRPDAAEWLNLMQFNDISRANRTCAAQAGGTACSIVLWTKPPTTSAR